jgi:hypothetical protein
MGSRESDEYEVVTHWKLWHLTEAGWVDGSSKSHYEDAAREVPAPADTLKTVRVEYVGSAMRGGRNTHSVIFEKKGRKKVIQGLEGKFGASDRLNP